MPSEAQADGDELPARGLRRAWEGGRDGRAVLDRICAAAPDHLRPGGFVLLVHSSVNGLQQTVDRLAAGRPARWTSSSAVRVRSGRCCVRAPARWRSAGCCARGQRHEELLVIRGRRR